MDISLTDLKLRRPLPEEVGGEQVFHFEDTQSYRSFCERAKAAGYDFPNCLSGVDVGYGLRSVLHLRRLSDKAEISAWLDITYKEPHAPSVSDLWGGLEWHEREAYDLVGIHYQGHPDLRRILLEDDWKLHPLQRQYDTGGYKKEGWEAVPWPDWDKIAQEKEDKRLAEEAKKAARAKPAAKEAKEAAGGDSPKPVRPRPAAKKPEESNDSGGER